MAVNTERYLEIAAKLKEQNVSLVAVSKTRPPEDILELYNLGQRDFGENYVQELVDKQAQLPGDIRWHFIGHLQTNKVKYIAGFVYLIHGIDSLKLLKEVNKQAEKNNRIIEVLLQVHIAKEETKFGLDDSELDSILNSTELSALQHIKISGLMGMASFTDNREQIRKEFRYLEELFRKHGIHHTENCHFKYLSMGMSNDYLSAIEEGSTMVRIGSLLFGERKKQ